MLGPLGSGRHSRNQGIGTLIRQHGQLAIQHRHIHNPAFTGTFPVGQGGIDGDSRVQASDRITGWNAQTYGWSAFFAGQAHDA